MAPETILAQFSKGRGIQQKTAIYDANRSEACILSNKDFDQRLVLSDVWKSEKRIYPVWTGTYVAHKKAGEKLGNAIKYTDPNTGTIYVFEIPWEYQHERDAIIAVQHGFLAGGKPIISIHEDGKNMLIEVADKSKIIILPKFPGENGWYFTDDTFGIPIGNRVSSGNANARYLWRVDEYSGLIARSYDNTLDSGCRGIILDHAPSQLHGVLTEEILR